MNLSVIFVNENGTVTFLACDDDGEEGVYQSSNVGTQKLLRSGETNALGEVFGVNTYQVNDSGQTAIAASFDGNQNEVLYFYDAQMGLQTIAFEGQNLNGGQINNLTLRPTSGFSGLDFNFLPMDQINNLGQVAFRFSVDVPQSDGIAVWSRSSGSARRLQFGRNARPA